MIRNVPPTAPTDLKRAELSPPEKYRSYDESAVLVGDEKTMADARKLLNTVKKIKPACLNDMQRLWIHRVGLDKALVTANPLVPAQNVSPGRRDPLVAQLNEGPRTVLNAPGRFSLEIANFTGRSTFDVNGAKAMPLDVLKRSPLATANDDAEKLAIALAKTPEIRGKGLPVYVYHDRESSKVFVGSFQSPQDPAAARLQQYLVQNAVTIMDRKKGRNYGVRRMIAPANALTDLEPFREKAGLTNSFAPRAELGPRSANVGDRRIRPASDGEPATMVAPGALRAESVITQVGDRGSFLITLRERVDPVRDLCEGRLALLLRRVAGGEGPLGRVGVDRRRGTVAVPEGMPRTSSSRAGEVAGPALLLHELVLEVPRLRFQVRHLPLELLVVMLEVADARLETADRRGRAEERTLPRTPPPRRARLRQPKAGQYVSGGRASSSSRPCSSTSRELGEVVSNGATTATPQSSGPVRTGNPVGRFRRIIRRRAVVGERRRLVVLVSRSLEAAERHGDRHRQGRHDRAHQRAQQTHQPHGARDRAEAKRKLHGRRGIVRPDEPEHQTQNHREQHKLAVNPQVAHERRPAPLVRGSHGDSFTRKRLEHEISNLRGSFHRQPIPRSSNRNKNTIRSCSKSL